MEPTIRANIFHIRHHILVNTFDTYSLGQFPYLKLILKGISKLDPIPKGTIPITSDIVSSLVATINNDDKTWFMYVLEVMFIFAWAFCLRCSEYTKTEHWDAPLRNSVTFTTDKSDCPCISYKLDRRKTRTHDEVEPIILPCTCRDFGLCAYHKLKTYKARLKAKGITSKYLFVYKRNGNWKPFSASTFRRELGKLLKGYFKKAYDSHIHRAHGFRYGGITDLGSIGIPYDLIRRISGHAPDSKVLLQYLKLSPETVANLINTSSNKSKWKKLRKKVEKCKVFNFN